MYELGLQEDWAGHSISIEELLGGTGGNSNIVFRDLEIIFYLVRWKLDFKQLKQLSVLLFTTCKFYAYKTDGGDQRISKISCCLQNYT